MRWLTLMITAALAFGCDDEAGVTAEDGGHTHDGAHADAHQAADAAMDAQVRADAAIQADMAIDADAAVDSDAQVNADAAVEADAGVEGDAAIEADGALPDAGQPPERVFRDRYPINAMHTEGGIYDPVGHAFFVSSLTTGGVYRIDANTGEESTLFEPDEPGVWWTLGLAIDAPANRLYVCAMDDRRELDEDDDYAGYLWGFDLDTGERDLRIPLAQAAAGGTCTDVAVGNDGTVYVNDRENPRMYIMPEGGDLELLVEDDELSGAVVGQNALLVTPDQSALLSVVYLPSKLVRVDLEDLSVTEVDIEGDFFDGLPALSGADGMAFSGNTILVMFTSQLNRLRPLTADWRTAISSTEDVDSGQTDIVNTPMGDYMLNGQAVQFGFGRDADPSVLERFDGDL